MTAIADSDVTPRDERRAMSVASGAHALHDGYTDLIYVLLPVWQAEFGIGYGLLRYLYGPTARAPDVYPSTSVLSAQPARN